MLKVSDKLLFLYFLVFFLGLNGCVSLSTLQSPQVLEKGQKSLGLGLSGFYEESSEFVGIYEFDIFARYGLANKLDGGIKVFGLPGLTGGVQGDLKYQVLEKPFFVSLDIASSYAIALSLDDDEKIHIYGITPLILLGNRTFYGGAKINYFTSLNKIDFFGSSSKSRSGANMPALVFGAMLGKKGKFIPEVNIYFLDGETALVFGIGLQGKSPSRK